MVNENAPTMWVLDKFHYKDKEDSMKTELSDEEDLGNCNMQVTQCHIKSFEFRGIGYASQ